MTRWFNVAGPCNADDNYMLPAAARLPEVPRLLTQKSHFVLHAPRQTGKTTAMISLAHDLTASGRYAALMLSVEVGAPFSDNPGAAKDAILDTWIQVTEYYLPADLRPPPWPHATAGRRIGAALEEWSRVCPRPVVVFIDKIDSLQNETLVSILRQLRNGYARRPTDFPWSLALIRLRDVRDYKVASGGSQRLHTASPFNIKARSLTLRNFTRDEVAALYEQHTADTGQIFTRDAQAHAFELTQGQPWLVNALAKVAVKDLVPDVAEPVTITVIGVAKEVLMQRQDTHLDSLAERLREPRVRAIIEPMLSGEELGNLPNDDRQFVIDLGLVRRDPQGGLVVANPMCREVLLRVLASGPQDSLPHIAPRWLRPDGSLDPDVLLESFLAFLLQHSEPLLKSAPYHEIAPHLVLMAFLHRVVNGNGTLEYALGTDRIDLCLRYGAVTLGIELKVWRDGRPDPLQAGLAQLDSYLAHIGATAHGWLVIFDRRSRQPPTEERLQMLPAMTPGGRDVVLIRA